MVSKINCNDCKYLHPKINERLGEQEKYGTIKLKELAVGSKLNVQTKNTLYKIKVLGKTDDGNIEIQGGKFFPKKRKVFLAGSTFGGSMLAFGQIGVTMFMEIHFDGKRLITSEVKNIIQIV